MKGHRSAPITFTADPQDFCNLWGSKVGSSPVTSFACFYHFVENFNRFREAGIRVGFVHVIDVNIVGLKTLERSVDFTKDVFPAEPLILGRRTNFHADLCSQNNLTASVQQRFSQDLLDYAARRANVTGITLVYIGCIYQIDTVIDRIVCQFDRVRLINGSAEGPDMSQCGRESPIIG